MESLKVGMESTVYCRVESTYVEPGELLGTIGGNEEQDMEVMNLSAGVENLEVK
jgi:hypothetical protein